MLHNKPISSTIRTCAEVYTGCKLFSMASRRCFDYLHLKPCKLAQFAIPKYVTWYEYEEELHSAFFTHHTISISLMRCSLKCKRYKQNPYCPSPWGPHWEVWQKSQAQNANENQELSFFLYALCSTEYLSTTLKFDRWFIAMNFMKLKIHLSFPFITD